MFFVPNIYIFDRDKLLGLIGSKHNCLLKFNRPRYYLEFHKDDLFNLLVEKDYLEFSKGDIFNLLL